MGTFLVICAEPASVAVQRKGFFPSAETCGYFPLKAQQSTLLLVSYNEAQSSLINLVMKTGAII